MIIRTHLELTFTLNVFIFLMTNGTSRFANYPEADPNLSTEEAISATVKNKQKSSVFWTSSFLQRHAVVSIAGRQGGKDGGKREAR